MRTRKTPLRLVSLFSRLGGTGSTSRKTDFASFSTAWSRYATPLAALFALIVERFVQKEKRGEGDSNPRVVTNTGLAILRPTRLSYLRNSVLLAISYYYIKFCGLLMFTIQPVNLHSRFPFLIVIREINKHLHMSQVHKPCPVEQLHGLCISGNWLD